MKCTRLVALCLGTALGIAAATFARPASAQTRIVDRVVAVVEQVPIFGSTLRERAAPLVRKLEASVEDPVQRETARSRLFDELLRQMVDEAVIEQGARAEQVSVTEGEIDDVLKQIAAQNRFTVEQLLAHAEVEGFTKDVYRAELRRQVLEGKLLRAFMARRGISVDRLGPVEQQQRIAQERHAMLVELRAKTFIEVRL
ncbi:SurA N-terminal domain-containing protein [Chondromyces crocatus]|uniref:SurA N-terminal domain-containing protein n=1 Tax=Chondromyces crocatus TaxID=52 RepID=A0A0K1EJ56_CHOCO|nr:SurA N-terminal domain-containing protein [Chondromyces crocatus]AKT40900.1 uncharacterized protein CMC5_050570 [Chondromyces crocatus]